MNVTICDVGPRDGRQDEQAVWPPAARAEPVDRLAATGRPGVEALRFVPSSGDSVDLLHGEGVETDVDLDALLGASRWREDLLGRTLSGRV